VRRANILASMLAHDAFTYISRQKVGMGLVTVCVCAIVFNVLPMLLFAIVPLFFSSLTQLDDCYATETNFIYSDLDALQLGILQVNRTIQKTISNGMC
jgi:hypothetical protein